MGLGKEDIWIGLRSKWRLRERTWCHRRIPSEEEEEKQSWGEKWIIEWNTRRGMIARKPKKMVFVRRSCIFPTFLDHKLRMKEEIRGIAETGKISRTILWCPVSVKDPISWHIHVVNILMSVQCSQIVFWWCEESKYCDL